METGLFCGSLPATLRLLFPSNVSFDIILSNIKTPMFSDFFWMTYLLIECKGLNLKAKILSCHLLYFWFPETTRVQENNTFLHFLNVYFRATVWEPPGWTDFSSCRTDVSLLQSSFVKDFSSASNLIMANYGDWIGKE